MNLLEENGKGEEKNYVTKNSSYNRQRLPWRWENNFNQQSFKRKTRRTYRCCH